MNNCPIKKPCPFCGGSPDTATVTIGKGQIGYYMTCFTNTCPMYNSCGALLSFATPAEAIENWNIRMGDAQASVATGDQERTESQDNTPSPVEIRENDLAIGFIRSFQQFGDCPLTRKMAQTLERSLLLNQKKTPPVESTSGDINQSKP